MAREAPGKRWAMVAIKLLLVVVVFWFVRRTVLDGLRELGQYSLDIRPEWLAVSAVLYVAGLLPAAFFWWRVLRALGQHVGLAETLRAYYIGHLGKYVPGKAMVVILRTGLIRSQTVDTGVAAVSVFFETLSMMSVGALLAAGILAFWYHEQVLLCLVSVALMIAAGLPLVPPVFRRLVRLAGVGRSDPQIASKIAALSWPALLEGLVAMTACWAMLGGSLWAVLQAIHSEPLPLFSQFPLYVASVALAMVAGFLSLIPGGAAVREMVLAQLLGRHFGDVVAVLSAVLLRLVWLLGEVVVSAVLYFTGRQGADITDEDRLE